MLSSCGLYPRERGGKGGTSSFQGGSNSFQGGSSSIQGGWGHFVGNLIYCSKNWPCSGFFINLDLITNFKKLVHDSEGERWIYQFTFIMLNERSYYHRCSFGTYDYLALLQNLFCALLLGCFFCSEKRLGYGYSLSWFGKQKNLNYSVKISLPLVHICWFLWLYNICRVSYVGVGRSFVHSHPLFCTESNIFPKWRKNWNPKSKQGSK